ncbi:hypothetical protein LSTR_LSTR014668 [Laodelphax striatellus]|uniref:AAA+ ATPase domain-containing protein n=1 Tax=Laodelphax striatellus TaxID=195883 RepID=A0A482X0Q0_LAOST|nr:hypothetical protein LSTR_LSTR014668 [Laodelphax striatellus]
MGSSCSSGQAHKDKDSSSQGSEDSPSYHVTKTGESVFEPHPASTSSSSQPQQLQQPQPTTSAASVSSGVVLRVDNPEPSPRPGDRQGACAAASVSAESASPSSPPDNTAEPTIAIDKTTLPPIIRKLPDELQHLLLGTIPAAKTVVRARKITIYVAAADSQDCCLEKGILHSKVYPILRKEAREHGYELHITDLHWRTTLEKQQDHEFPELCVEQLNRQVEVSYTIPVIFLSDSLGTPLLPKTIEAQDFEMVLQNPMTDAADRNHLQDWYRLDSDAQPPCYRLQSFKAEIPGLKDFRSDERARALAEWQAEVDHVFAVLLAAFSEELRDSYLTTVVEQEVHNTVVMSQELAKRCVWLQRVFTHQPLEELRVTTKSEAELKRRLDSLQRSLKTNLEEKHVLRISVPWSKSGLDQSLPDNAQYAADVTVQLRIALLSIINEIVDDDPIKLLPPLSSSFGINSEMFYELSRQAQFIQKLARCSVNGEGVMSQMKSYINGEVGNNKIFVLHGTQGSGKSTLVARAAVNCHHWLPDSMLAARFVGVTSESLTMEQILRTVLAQCEIIEGGKVITHKHSLDTYAQIFRNTLATTALQRAIIIILDGLDQVHDFGSDNYDWLPTSLPSNVRMIVTANDDNKVNHLERIERRLGSTGGYYVKMPTLNEEEAQNILMSSVIEYNHSVNSTVQDCVKASVAECTLPLYIKVLAWHTSWIVPGSEIEVIPKGNVEKQVKLMLEQLETLLGTEQVAIAMALLVASKFGLSDSEMLDVLAHDTAFHSTSTYLKWAPACLFWARFVKRMWPFLTWLPAGGTCVIQWRDAAIRHIVRKKYSNRMSWAHSILADYFKGELCKRGEDRLDARFFDQTNSVGNGRYNCRRLEELPYHCCKQNDKNYVRDYVFNHIWIYDKLCGTSVYQVLEDIRMAPNDCAISHDISWLRTFLEINSTGLGVDGRQFFTLLGAPDLYRSSYSQLCVAWSQLAIDPPVTCLTILPQTRERALSTSSRDSQESNMELLSKTYFDNIYRLPKSCDYVITTSGDREEICVWDAVKCTRVRTLRKVTQPLSLVMIDDYQCVVLCKRELRTYDLNAGHLISKLKGVMNQKMPYYGLNDPSHLVALSRNRMYVNLMNLDTGDLVTTFKAGEDRFLNSLLVSGDGRILVCGDETQKPFPLLVWDLTSRKLLYDLRISHHDFMTELAAITFEGHFVCCVAREVDEPGPNFIVVYDLQSGTLFKKWKAGVDCVALDISSKDACVLSGHEDGRILLWDLVTGNCRCKLMGHSGPVSCLRLDPSGGTFISYDTESRDRSMRVWNIAKGEQSAVYTPNRRITAAEIVSGGQFVVIALEGVDQLITLQIIGPGKPRTDGQIVKMESDYNLVERCGKVFDCEDKPR